MPNEVRPHFQTTHFLNMANDLKEIDRKDIVKQVSEATGVDTETVETIIAETFYAIADNTANFERVDIHGVGVFRTAYRKPKIVYPLRDSPDDPEKVELPARYKIEFKPSPNMLEALNTILEERNNPLRFVR